MGWVMCRWLLHAMPALGACALATQAGADDARREPAAPGPTPAAALVHKAAGAAPPASGPVLPYGRGCEARRCATPSDRPEPAGVRAPFGAGRGARGQMRGRPQPP